MRHLAPRRRAARAALLAGLSAAATLVGGTSTAALAAAPSPATAVPSVAACATVHSDARVRAGKAGVDPNELTKAEAARSEQRVNEALRRTGLGKGSSLPVQRVTVPVRVHVITRDDGTGAPPAANLSAQLNVLNDAYAGKASAADAPTIFRFTVKSVDVTRNSDWYDWSLENDDDDVQAKQALHQGGKRDLNVYVTGLGDGLLGYSSFPFDSEPLYEDGVVILNDSLPGGAAAPYNEGDTLTHEVGHWLGLYHTFENGCTAPGDEVGDTPYQADGDNIFFCNESDDTCPAAGRDPVHNFMSYGDDPCLDRFSRGQSLRMGLVWLAFRSGLRF